MGFDQLAEAVAEAIIEVFEPLTAAFSDPAAMATMLDGLGWPPPESPVGPGDLGPLADVVSAVGAAGELLEQYRGGGTADPQLLGQLTDAVLALGRSLSELAAPALATLPEPWGQPEMWATLGEDLSAWLVMLYLRRRLPSVYAGLLMLGVIAESAPAVADAGGDSPPDQIRGTHVRLHWDRIALWFTDPGQAAAVGYGWGADFDVPRLLRAVAAAGEAFGLPVGLIDVGPPSSVQPMPVPTNASSPRLAARLPLYQQAVSGADDDTNAELSAAIEVGIQVLATGTVDDQPTGVFLGPYAVGSARADFEVTTAVHLVVSGSAGTNADVGVALTPAGVAPVGDPAAVSAGLGLRVAYTPDQPLVVFGSPTGTGVTLGGAELGFELQDVTTTPELIINVLLRGLHVGIDLSNGDSFLGSLAGDQPPGATFDLDVSWSSTSGVRLNSQSGLKATIPLDVAMGPLSLSGVTAGVQPVDDRVDVTISVSGGASVGPLAASVDQVGLRLRFQPSTDSASGFGGLAMNLAFKPPAGIGLAIDTPAVSGGGFLLIDPDAGQYAGVFELTLVGSISIKAIAIISTKMPDGSPGFALLILITAEGFTPIQLGMGFSLTGIGGLLALNRTIEIDVVRNGLRDGVLDSILFVKDPVKNAPRIISTLNKVFPLAAGRLVIGPLAEISWGTPALVKIRLALLLEIPQPVRVVLLAQLSLVLPDEKAPVVELHVDAVGALDFGKGELSLDASIHDSRILKFALSGDLALRLSWGENPTFLLSVGGFHPKFPQPAGLRKLERLTLTLSDSENPKIRFETYLALTSNSIQLGARVSVYATAGGFGIDGGGSFDALIQWAPFSLDVSFEAWVRIFGPTGTLLSARLALEVTGPEPWHLTGVAEFSVLFVTARVAVDLSIGDAVAAAATETVDVAGAIWAELSQAGSWQATLASAVTPGVTLIDQAAAAAGAGQATADAPLVIHPLAGVVGRQRVAPLDRAISRVGAHRPTAGTRQYSLQVTVPAGVRVDAALEQFAPAQYADLPDDAKLSGPSFALMPAGAAITADAAAAHPGVGVAVSDVSMETLDVTSLDDVSVPAPLSAVATPAFDSTAARMVRDASRSARHVGAQGLMLT